MSCCKDKRQFIDLSKIEPELWSDAEYIVGLDKCGNVLVVDKPLYELTEDDRDKLDMLITDGEGNLYLSDDGTYKSVVVDSINNIILTYTESPVNFVILNVDKLNEIKELLTEGTDTFVRMDFGTIVLPCKVSYSDTQLTLEVSNILLQSPISTRAVSTVDFRFLIVLDTTTSVPTVVAYEQIPYEMPDLSDYVKYNDNDDIEARNNIILKNDANLLGTTLDGSTINLIQCSRFTDEGHPITDIGSTTAHMTLNSYDRPNVQLSNESGNHLHQVAYLSEVIEVGELLNNEIENREAGDANLQTQLDATNEYAQDTRNALIEGLATINQDLSALDTRVTNNTTNISINTTDIEAIRNELNEQEHFRGVYTNSIDIVTDVTNPSVGDYAYSLETGTIWTYDGTNWSDSGTAIPNGVYSFSDDIPLMDNVNGSAGTANTISRSDHRHPSDISKADITALNDYLPLVGNSQTTPITGDVWLANTASLRLSSSGNSFIMFSEDNATLQVKGNGIGGVDLLSDNGTVKANGQRVIVNGNNTPSIQLSSNVIQFNTGGATGSSLSLASAQTALEGNILAANFVSNINIDSAQGDIVFTTTVGKVYYGASNISTNEVATIGYVDDNIANVNDIITNIGNSIAANYLNLQGGTLTGDLTLASSSIYMSNGNGIYFNNGATSLVYTGNELDINSNTRVNYNGNEIATLADIVSSDIQVIDNLNSVDTENALSANQGRVLNSLIVAESSDRINSINDLQSQINDIDTSITTIDNNISTINNDITTLGDRIDTIESTVSTNTTSINDLQTTLNELVTTVNELQSQIDNIVANVYSYDTTVDSSSDTITLPNEPTMVLLVTFDRVALSNDEYTVDGSVITITSTDAVYNSGTKVKVLYK